jgi:hypothetical protein
MEWQIDAVNFDEISCLLFSADKPIQGRKILFSDGKSFAIVSDLINGAVAIQTNFLRENDETWERSVSVPNI